MTLDPAEAPARIEATVTELAARWHRIQDRNAETFAQGRASGYVQAIALLLGTEYRAVLAALENGEL